MERNIFSKGSFSSKNDQIVIWEEILKNLENILDEYSLKVIKTLKPKLESDNLISFLVPNEEYKDWLIDIVGDILKQEFSKRGKDFKVEVIKKTKENISSFSALISKKYTFDNFVVGASNEVAFKSSVEVANNPGELYNPLFIYGKVGTGKTHLLHAIGNFCLEKDLNVCYTSMNDFTEEMVLYLRSGHIMDFREKYKSVDVLLLDDIQFLSGKERTQIELFNVFNYLFYLNKQIVFAADQHPRNIKDVSERLLSRFEGGLLVEIGIDDMTKLSIIKQKVTFHGLPLDDRIIDYIKDNTSNNAREIEGLILQIRAKGSFLSSNIEKVEQLYDDYCIASTKENKKDKEIDPKVIIYEVESYFKISTEKDKRGKKSLLARQISMYLLRELTNLSLSDISKLFNYKNHSSAFHAIKKIEELIVKDEKISYTVERLKTNIKSHVYNR